MMQKQWYDVKILIGFRQTKEGQKENNMIIQTDNHWEV